MHVWTAYARIVRKDWFVASITTRGNGSRFIGFVDAGGRRRFISLGKVPARYARSVKVKVEDLVSSSITCHPPADETARWLAGLDEKMLTKLARVGLARARRRVTLGEWLEQYLDEREDELKPESLRKLAQTRDKLLAGLDPALPLRKITLDQASRWRQFLKGLRLSKAAIKTHCGNAKQIMTEALRRKLPAENPFAHLKSGPTPSRYERYITPDEIEAFLEACPDAEWGLLFGLARYAGLRVPSESHGLTWADVDWQRGRLTVRSPKTEHHVGHEKRLVPITPRLMALLQDRFEECPEGKNHLVSLRISGALQRKVRRFQFRAGVERWKRLFQTLRQSCEKQWAMQFPQYAVSKWIGHSIEVSGRHYANAVPDELFDRAAGVDQQATPKAQRNAQQKVPETS